MQGLSGTAVSSLIVGTCSCSIDCFCDKVCMKIINLVCEIQMKKLILDITSDPYICKATY